MTRSPESFELKPRHAAVAMTLQLPQQATVLILTAPFDGETSPRKSNCWLLRRVGPEQAKQALFPASVVTTGAVNEVLFSGSVDITGGE